MHLLQKILGFYKSCEREPLISMGMFDEIIPPEFCERCYINECQIKVVYKNTNLVEFICKDCRQMDSFLNTLPVRKKSFELSID